MQSLVICQLSHKPSLLALHYSKIQIFSAIRCINAQREPAKGHDVQPSTSSSSTTKPLNKQESTSDVNMVTGRTSMPAWSADSGRVQQRVSQEIQKMETYMFTRYFDHVKNYDKVLEKNFPSAVKAYRKFFDGVKEFFTDMKNYLKISRISNTSPKGLKALNRKELELFMRMPNDMFKVAPAIIGSSLPIFGYLMFPIVFMYPRTFLTPHFWTLQQRIEFQQLELQERLRCNRDVLRQLQAKLKAVKSHEQYEQLEFILSSMGSGLQPSVENILAVKDLFTEPPYRLNTLSNKHMKLLMKMHGLKGFFKEYRLCEHAYLVHYMDLAIRQEGDVHNMSPDALRYSCFIRGLNTDNLPTSEMISWLRNWVKISTAIQTEHISLFLHLPILLGYNHPNNWQLIYRNKK